MSVKQEIFYSVGEECVSLSSAIVRNDLAFKQCEADTIMLSIYAVLRSAGYNDPVVIDTEDTDVFVQAATISHDFSGILCIKKKEQLLFCRGMCSDDIAKCLISFHVLTGCDANSCFFGYGKKSLFGKMKRSPEARHLLLKMWRKPSLAGQHNG